MKRRINLIFNYLLYSFFLLITGSKCEYDFNFVKIVIITISNIDKLSIFYQKILLEEYIKKEAELIKKNIKRTIN